MFTHIILSTRILTHHLFAVANLLFVVVIVLRCCYIRLSVLCFCASVSMCVCVSACFSVFFFLFFCCFIAFVKRICFFSLCLSICSSISNFTSKSTDRRFLKISPEMYLWTRKSPLSYRSHLGLCPDLEMFWMTLICHCGTDAFSNVFLTTREVADERCSGVGCLTSYKSFDLLRNVANFENFAESPASAESALSKLYSYNRMFSYKRINK